MYYISRRACRFLISEAYVPATVMVAVVALASLGMVPLPTSRATISALSGSGSIIDCTFTRNGGSSLEPYHDIVRGGGIYLGQRFRILDSAILENEAELGGGVYGSGVVPTASLPANSD